jgi:hypothetical protein
MQLKQAIGSGKGKYNRFNKAQQLHYTSREDLKQQPPPTPMIIIIRIIIQLHYCLLTCKLNSSAANYKVSRST